MQVIAFHVVVEGTLLAAVEGLPAVEVEAGEIILFPQNDGHRLASDPHVPPVRARDLVQRAADGMGRIDHGGGGRTTRIVCGYLGAEEAFNPLLATLPRMLQLDISQATSRDWIESSVRFAAAELIRGRLASSTVVSRLSEVLLVEAVREYASSENGSGCGWLKGIRDPNIGRALALMHQGLDMPWTAEMLAKRVAMSRSSFVERFTDLVGVPPIRYLTVCRLTAARAMLEETSKSVAQIAHAAGYDSEEAFSRAYKRAYGVSPARWRSERSKA